MSSTTELINRLAADARPVKRLRPPALRAALWLTVAALLLVAIAGVHGFRPGLMAEFADPVFALGRAAAVMTAVTAAVAAFHVSLPDRSPRWLWLPLPFALVWFGAMGYGCFTDWLVRGPAGLQLGHGGGCFGAILFSSLPIGALLLVMVRHAGPVRPFATAAAGGLAVAAIAEAGLTLYHDVDATLTDILFHFLAVLVVCTIWTAGARPLFRAVAQRR
jgi:hypothetical protein